MSFSIADGSLTASNANPYPAQAHNPYSTGIHGTARTHGVWRYEYVGMGLDERDTAELVRAARNWRSLDGEQRSAAQQRLNMAFNSVFKPLWGEDAWYEHELEITDAYVLRVGAVKAGITAEAASTVRPGARDWVKCEITRPANSVPWVVRLLYVGHQRFEPRDARYSSGIRETRL